MSSSPSVARRLACWKRAQAMAAWPHSWEMSSLGRSRMSRTFRYILAMSCRGRDRPTPLDRQCHVRTSPMHSRSTRMARPAPSWKCIKPRMRRPSRAMRTSTMKGRAGSGLTLNTRPADSRSDGTTRSRFVRLRFCGLGRLVTQWLGLSGRGVTAPDAGCRRPRRPKWRSAARRCWPARGPCRLIEPGRRPCRCSAVTTAG